MRIGRYLWALIVDHSARQCQLVFHSNCSELRKQISTLHEKHSGQQSPAVNLALQNSFKPHCQEQYQQSIRVSKDYIAPATATRPTLPSISQRPSRAICGRLHKPAQAAGHHPTRPFGSGMIRRCCAVTRAFSQSLDNRCRDQTDQRHQPARRLREEDQQLSNSWLTAPKIAPRI